MYVCAAPFAKKPHKSGQIHACLQGVSSLWELYPAGKSKEISIANILLQVLAYYSYILVKDS